MKKHKKNKIVLNKKDFLNKVNLYSNTIDGNEMIYVSDIESWLNECKCKKSKKLKKENELEILLIKALLEKK